MNRVPLSTSLVSPAVLATALAAALAAAACGGSSAPAPAKPGPTGPAQPAELTTAEAVLEASLVAQGGRERMSKLKAIRQTGSLELAQMGLKGAMSAIGAAPRSMRSKIELSGLGTIEQGVSGDLVWELNPATGARIVTGAQRTQQLRDATFNGDLVWKELYPKAELAGIVDFAGAKAYKVVLTPAEGDPQTRYIAKDTLLPLGSESVVETQMGRIPAETRFSDWREVGGIKYPHRIDQKQGAQTFAIVIDQIELDPAIDPAAFAVPPQIEALQPKP